MRHQVADLFQRWLQAEAVEQDCGLGRGDRELEFGAGQAVPLPLDGQDRGGAVRELDGDPLPRRPLHPVVADGFALEADVFQPERRKLVQRFVDASIIGWYNYLYGDNKAANDLIKKDNPDMTDEKIAYAIKGMTEKGIVHSGDSLKLGIGAMTDERWSTFYKDMNAAGVFPAGIDFKKAYSLEFINKGIGA